ncbi:sulfatase-like hydrolase/transferase, partial [Mycobacterium tuberculosis]|nr:sulfatase-like hydrolase/transferase [Mycobacterium tuberculosis]
DYVERWADFAYPLGARAKDSLADKPEHQRLWADAMPAPVGADGCYRHPMYFACNDFVDDQIGEVVAAAGSNPWIVYTSDHGEMMGAHRMVSKG